MLLTKKRAGHVAEEIPQVKVQATTLDYQVLVTPTHTAYIIIYNGMST